MGLDGGPRRRQDPSSAWAGAMVGLSPAGAEAGGGAVSTSESWNGLMPSWLQAWFKLASSRSGHGWRHKAQFGGWRRARTLARQERWYGCSHPGQRTWVRRGGPLGRMGSKHVGQAGGGSTASSSVLLSRTVMAGGEGRAWAERGCRSTCSSNPSPCCRGACTGWRRSSWEDAMGQEAAPDACVGCVLAVLTRVCGLLCVLFKVVVLVIFRFGQSGETASRRGCGLEGWAGRDGPRLRWVFAVGFDGRWGRSRVRTACPCTEGMMGLSQALRRKGEGPEGRNDPLLVKGAPVPEEPAPEKAVTGRPVATGRPGAAAAAASWRARTRRPPRRPPRRRRRGGVPAWTGGVGERWPGRPGWGVRLRGRERLRGRGRRSGRGERLGDRRPGRDRELAERDKLRGESLRERREDAERSRPRSGEGAARWSATSPPSLSQEATLRETVLPSVAPRTEAPARDNTAGSMARRLNFWHFRLRSHWCFLMSWRGCVPTCSHGIWHHMRRMARHDFWGTPSFAKALRHGWH